MEPIQSILARSQLTRSVIELRIGQDVDDYSEFDRVNHISILLGFKSFSSFQFVIESCDDGQFNKIAHAVLKSICRLRLPQ
ncbi:hypothetical protein [Pseudomonas psychrophila]|uniref:Uncharacterized protein n=1 Tax=Pseudomonas psychrophila TaxID=122355 RepID=A0A8I1KAM6_9PSED|nr:hypothetical protein [Pseudomonas psychrophila]MBJ2260056.1 hypothetical protein [Pseudomonas psychrophila]